MRPELSVQWVDVERDGERHRLPLPIRFPYAPAVVRVSDRSDDPYEIPPTQLPPDCPDAAPGYLWTRVDPSWSWPEAAAAEPAPVLVRGDELLNAAEALVASGDLPLTTAAMWLAVAAAKVRRALETAKAKETPCPSSPR